MSFLTTIIDDYLAESGVSLAYFDKEGNVHGITHGDQTSYPSYEDYYLAMGAFISKEVQSKYTKKLRFWVFWEAIQGSAILLSLLIGVISMILAFITKGEGWPEGIITIAIILGMGPLLGYLSYNWLFKTWATTMFENAYNRELAKKKSAVAIQKVKREKNWVFIVTVTGLLALGFFDSWINVVGILAFALLSMLFGMMEGILLIGLEKLFAPLFAKKKKSVQKEQIELSPELLKQVKKRFKVIYQDFQIGKYAAAFERFDACQKSWEDFNQEVQDFLSDQNLTAFHLIPFDEAEIAILEVADSHFEADLFLYDTEAKEFPEFYLICKVSYQDEILKTIELVELGY